MKGPKLIQGGVYRDARGEMRYVNGFGFEKVDRFYSVHPSVLGQVRGWVGHKRDWKWFCVLRGAMEIGVVLPDNWTTPSRELAEQCFGLSADNPAILEVPAGFFTASVAYAPDSTLLVFSTGQIDEAKTDDFRLPADYWHFTPRGSEGANV